MISFIVDVFKRIQVELSFLGFKPRDISLEISLTILYYILMMFNFVRTIILDTFGTMYITYKSYISPFSAILVLRNTRIHIYASNCYNMVTNVKAFIN